MIKRKMYINVKAKTLNGVSEYLKEILVIEKETEKEDLLKELSTKAKDLSDKRVWVLFGINNGKDGECLQVAESINIMDEIKNNIKFMFNEKYSKLKAESNEIKSVNTQFYENTYCMPKDGDKNKRKYIYSKMKEEYNKLVFYELDIDKYMGVENHAINSCTINCMVKLSKPYFAETKFAYETQSIYWNVYRSGIGVEVLKELNSRLL